jgi:hypothetical protein
LLLVFVRDVPMIVIIWIKVKNLLTKEASWKCTDEYSLDHHISIGFIEDYGFVFLIV